MKPLHKAYVATVAAILVAATHPAFALSSVDPAQGLQQITPWFFTVAAGAFGVGAIYKGVHAHMHGQSIGPHIVALISGIGLASAGAIAVQNW